MLRGTPEREIVIRAAPDENPVLEAPIVIRESEHLRIEGLTVSGTPYAGIHIKRGSRHITVANCTVARSGMGVWITENAGCHHVIRENRLHGNETHGIGVDAVNCAEGAETRLEQNEIYENGHHGIELHGSRYVVEANNVYRNGASLVGSSGIHVFSRGPADPAGDHNVIRYNVSYENRESKGPDGNGIQIDQWCDHNEVVYNIAFANDGAGIILFDAANALVAHNTTFDNARDPGGSHSTPLRGEMVLASSGHEQDRVHDVRVHDNIFVANQREAAAVVVDDLTSDNRLSIENNLVFHRRQGRAVRWAGREVEAFPASAAGRGSARAGMRAEPGFVERHPVSKEGLRLASGSPALGAGSCLGLPRDALGRALPAGPEGCDLGAIQEQER
jgi:parallel beta-helix repeat protein